MVGNGNEKSTDLKVTVLQGKERWIFFPSSEILKKKFSCSKKCSKGTSQISWMNQIVNSQFENTFYGQKISTAEVSSGDSLIIPSNFVSFVIPLEDSISLTEYFTARDGIEDLAVSLTPESLNKLNKELQKRDDRRIEFRRLSEVLKQIQEGRGPV